MVATATSVAYESMRSQMVIRQCVAIASMESRATCAGTHGAMGYLSGRTRSGWTHGVIGHASDGDMERLEAPRVKICYPRVKIFGYRV